MSEDDFIRGYEGVPSKPRMEAMSDEELFSRLGGLTPGSTQYFFYDAERKRREDSAPSVLRDENPQQQEQGTPDNDEGKKETRRQRFFDSTTANIVGALAATALTAIIAWLANR